METPFSFSVRTKGLEPPRLTALDPKSSAATNYATSAGFLVCKDSKKYRYGKEKKERIVNLCCIIFVISGL